MTSFEEDFDRQRALIPEVKSILANYLIGEAPAEEDMKRNTDLIVLRLDTIRVACRIRSYDYVARYPNEFTIRAGRPSGAETELSKMLSGWGDYIFYGFADRQYSTLAGWLLGDLKVFRLWHHRELWAGRKPGISQSNHDGSSTFRAYRITDLPNDFVVARVEPRSEAA